MKKCPSCVEADANTLTPFFNPDCKNCSARQLANGPELFAMERKGDAGPMRDAIRSVWSDEGYEAGKALVREWAEKIKAAKAALRVPT